MVLIKKIIIFICFFVGLFTYGQNKPKNVKIKEFNIVSDTIKIDSLSINSNYFRVYHKDNQLIDATYYHVDFVKSLLILQNNFDKSIRQIKVEYQELPEFLTKTYSAFDTDLIVPKATDESKLFSYQAKNKNNLFR